MNTFRHAASAACAAAVVASISVATFTVGSRQPDTVVTSPYGDDAPTVRPPATSVPPRVTAPVSPATSVVTDVACTPDAVPEASVLDPEVREQIPFNSVAQPLASQISRSEAITVGRSFSTDPDAAATAPAVAILAPYSWTTGDPTALIAPARCVWVITVGAPYRIKSAPVGIERPMFSWFTVTLDAASGDYLATNTGEGTTYVLNDAVTRTDGIVVAPS